MSLSPAHFTFAGISSHEWAEFVHTRAANVTVAETLLRWLGWTPVSPFPAFNRQRFKADLPPTEEGMIHGKENKSLAEFGTFLTASKPAELIGLIFTRFTRPTSPCQKILARF